MGVLRLEIVTPLGVAFEADGLDEIVLRRKEADRAEGSEIAIFRNHAPLLVLTGDHELRYVREGAKHRVHVAEGAAEVLDDTVTLLTSSVG